ncbi:hypothetical protein HAV15_008378 [Penicillium sp. str. |nr:hypothetical protein HAV15_008378 [Penicillium sp. str. \
MAHTMAHAMVHDIKFTHPEKESVASLFVQQYVMEDMIHYHEALSAVRELCDQVLSDHGIGHATEFRLKEPASLEKKLTDRERKQGFPYQTIEDIDKDIVDLAGVCILVHIPSNRIRASELLHDAFMVKKMVNHPKQDEVNGGQQANRGYVATHLHVLLKSEDVHDRGLQLSDTKPVEIQVTSTGLRAWASLEHDIIYKPKGKPPLGLLHQLATMRMLASVDENIHKQMEEVQNNRAAKRKRSLRFIDDVGWVFQKWLEEQQQAWFHDREAGSYTSLFNFLQSRNMDTHGGLRQVLEASFGSDSEVVYSRLASEYPTGSLTLVIFIMDRLLLTGGSGSGSGSGGVDRIPEDHQIHVYKLQTMMSTFVWLDRLFTPALTWQKVFAVQNQESLRDGLVLLHSTRYDFFLEGNPLGLDDIAIVDRLWNWFEGQHDRQIRLTFAISKNKMFKKRKDALKVIGPLIHGLRHWN